MVSMSANRKIILISLLMFSLFTIAQENCNFKIDKHKILSNLNLDKFLMELQNDNFEIYYDKKHIPDSLIKSLACLNGEFSIANPKEKYQTNCEANEKLPKRKLILLLKSKNNIVVTYFCGGFATSVHILFLRFNNGKITDLWSGISVKKLSSKEDILKYIKDNRNKKNGLNSSAIRI